MLHSLTYPRLLLLASACMLLLATVACSEPVTVPNSFSDVAGGADSGPPVNATAPAVMVAVAPAVVQAGSAGALVVLSATGIGVGAVVQVDGVTHVASIQSNTRAVLVLSPQEVANGTRHTLSIRNPGQASSNQKEVLVTDGYWAFGDSITAGATLASPSTQNYAYLLATSYRLKFVNSARSGDQACDVWPQMFRSGAGYTRAAAPLFSVMIGTNDVDVKGTGAYESIFTACDLAALSWLGTPRVNKVLAGDVGFSVAGSCTGAADSNALGAATCSGVSGTITASITTEGNAVYVWYLMTDAATAGDGITVTLDATTVGTYATRAAPAVATQNGSTQGMAVLRLPAAAGTHTIRVTTTGTAGVLGIGSNPEAGADHPRLLVGDLPNQAKDGPVAPAAFQQQYLTHILAAEQQLEADGMDVHRALTRDYMLGTVFEMSDQLHPNVLGQQKLATAFNLALP